MEGITVENSNAAFTGNIVDFGRNGAGADTAGNFVNRTLIAGLGVANANAALSLDQALFSRVTISNFQNAINLLQVFTGLLVAFDCGWVTHLVWHNNALPDFAGLALFIGTLYGTNKLAGTLSSKNPPQQ